MAAPKLVHYLSPLVRHLSLSLLHLLDKLKHLHDLNLALEQPRHGHGHHMLTLFPKASNPWNNMSWSSHVSPRTSPTRTPCSWPLTLSVIAGALRADTLSSTWRAPRAPLSPSLLC